MDLIIDWRERVSSVAEIMLTNSNFLTPVKGGFLHWQDAGLTA